MFERFTDRARRVVVLAQEEARMLNHNYIGTEHILLGLVHEGEGLAAKALDGLGVSLEDVRQNVEEIIGQGQLEPSGQIPFTPRAKRVLELGLREALQLNHDYIGTEHILLGLIREGEGVAAQVLVKLGADLGSVRERVIQLVEGEGEKAATPRDKPQRLKRKDDADLLQMLIDTFSQHSQASERVEALQHYLQLRGIESDEVPPLAEVIKVREERAKVRREKEAAIDSQNFEQAAELRDQEKELLKSPATDPNMAFVAELIRLLGDSKGEVA